ncbi:MAG: metal transporter, partial [Chloroflexota bacterium]
MSAETTSPTPKGMSGAAWALALVPLILLGVVLAYLVATNGGLTELAGPPVEQVSIQRITLPEPG